MSWFNTTAFKAALKGAFASTSSAASVAATGAAAKTAQGFRATPAFVAATAPKVGVDILKNLAFNIVLLEAVDAGEAVLKGRKRRRRIDELQTFMLGMGQAKGTKSFDSEKYAEWFAEWDRLSRKPKRRSFVQFLKDLPSRSWRRLFRAVLLEAGWWTMILTSPVWIPVGAFAVLWMLGVGLVDAWQNYGVPEEHKKDFVPTYERFNKPVSWVFKHTLQFGAKLFRKGATMRVWDRTVYTEETTFDAFSTAYQAMAPEGADFPVYSAGESARRVGESMADQVNEIFKDVHRQAAYAQSGAWFDKNINPDFRPDVMGGFRDRADFLYRDLVQEVHQ